MVVRVFKLPSSFPRMLGELPTRAIVDRLDLLHVQYVAPPIRSVPTIVMIHNICYEFFPEFYSRSEVLQFRVAIRWTVRHARHILTVSESSKSDIADTYKVAPAKIDVTYNGIDFARFRPPTTDSAVDAVLVKYGIKRPYVLAVGNLQPRKNLVRLLDAFIDLKRNHQNLPHKLVLVGKPAFRHSEIVSHVRKRSAEAQVILTGYVPDEDLPLLYGGATVFAYPSLYEGFGLPVAEAMACGIPTLTSDRSAVPEVAGDAAILVDPENARSINDGLLRILTDSDLAAKLAARGLERAQRFTWENTASATLAAYEAAFI
jgi:glycosyltransferase involved in cell wall biosynthesis